MTKKMWSAVASLLAAVFVSLAVGVGVSSYFAVESNQRSIANEKLAKKADEARNDAEAKTRLAQTEAANFCLNEAQARCAEGEAHIGLLWMARAHSNAVQAENDELADAARSMAASWLAQVPRLRSVPLITNTRTVARFGPEDRTIILAGCAGNTSKLPEALGFGFRVLDGSTHTEIERIPKREPIFSLPRRDVTIKRCIKMADVTKRKPLSASEGWPQERAEAKDKQSVRENYRRDEISQALYHRCSRHIACPTRDRRPACRYRE